MNTSHGDEHDQLAINTLRFLAVDQVEKAKSGHPGAPLGCAPIAYLLFHETMKFNPLDPLWSNRDRFVLSNGHASALLYAALHLTGYDLPMSQLQQFRQWGSHTPGHPEHGETPGVEVTTGPLGQGFAEAVGLAVAEAHLAAVYNLHDERVPVDHHTYVLCGDGDLMEGISHEAASLAGTLGLGKLIVFYDSNSVSLDGPTSLSFTEDVPARFRSYHWHVQTVSDGNDLDGLRAALRAARAATTQPSLICVQTVIGYGSPKAGTSAAHGEPLGPQGTRETKRHLGFPEEPPFLVPEAARGLWAQAVDKGRRAQDEWQRAYDTYKRLHPNHAAQFDRVTAGSLPEGWRAALPTFSTSKPLSTRTAGGQVIEALAQALPELLGGAADLTTSTKTIFKESVSFHVHPWGRNVFFGVREFAMMAIVNGMAAHGGVIPFGSTFFTFSDYCRSAIRMGALQSSHSLYIFTHDSVALGEDGPTHQPVEHLMALRSIPQLTDFRPADANETSACWQLALERKAASFMALSRQDLPVLDRDKYRVFEGVPRGAYKLVEGEDLILVATGAEVHLILEAARLLRQQDIQAAVISMPSFKLFEEQASTYKNALFARATPTISVEAGATLGWYKYIGRDGVAIGLDRFGASAPGPVVLKNLGISVERVVQVARTLVATARRPALGQDSHP
ncbi:MAG TPA: transketolase [Steroidobacteraceae bacterium]|jgi:transketolase|nr:transketolase [Steroidobacteraceae bacterium]